VVAARDPRETVVWAALDEVPDPEIPTISVVELGVIRGFTFEDGVGGGERLRVELLPTFVGCPAIDIMREQVGERLTALGVADEVVVELSFAEPWTSDRISEAGREKLRGSGFAPPAAGGSLLTMIDDAPCPYCGSRNTSLDNPFGPTLCRAIYHCDTCHQPFEQFKSV
jgi:ring-1,2-phenylacetyl-CoA epoxidase subunit PaaD